MKKIILIISLFVSLYSYEIKLNQTFTKEIVANKISFNISLTVEADNSQEVIKKLDAFSKFVTNFKTLNISGGKYNTYPKYIYEDKKRVQRGYKGSIRFVVSSTSKKDIKSFISKLTTKKISKKENLIISSSDWQIDEKLIEKTKEKLRLEAIKWSKTYAKKLDEDCKVLEIDFLKTDRFRPYVRTLNSVSKENDIPLPKQELKKLSIDVRYRFGCEL